MKKFTIALISALVALASCDTGLLSQTPGQPPLIAGIEVNGASDNLYSLLGAAGQLGLAAAWDDTALTNDSPYLMQSVGGEGSFKFASPVSLVLDGGFKIRQKGNWSNQIGIDGTGAEGADFTFNNLNAGFTGKTYVLVIDVLRGAGGKGFAKATLEERSDVRAPKAVTGAVTAAKPKIIKVQEIRIVNATAGQTYFLSGDEGAILKEDGTTNFTTGLTRYALSAKDGVAKDVSKTIASGATTANWNFSVARTSYTGLNTTTTTNYDVQYTFVEGKSIRIDVPYKVDGVVTADAPVLALNNSITVSTAGASLAFAENPEDYIWNLVYDATAKTYSLEVDVAYDYIVGWQLRDGDLATNNDYFVLNGGMWSDSWPHGWGSTSALAISPDAGGDGEVTFATAAETDENVQARWVPGTQSFFVASFTGTAPVDAPGGGWANGTSFNNAGQNHTLTSAVSYTADSVASSYYLRLTVTGATAGTYSLVTAP